MFAIRTDSLSKQYRLGQLRGGYSTLREDLVRLSKRVITRAEEPAAAETIWALRDVTFEIDPGEVVGIVGRNGAGKTTLLKILARITEPTSGYADIRGRLGSLLEVGTGFHPELTGRENVFLNGAILGMRRTEIKRKLDAIVEFAGVQKFIDTPVKRYSSGMYVRLAFSVAAYLETESLLVDEVLAVGDVEFQRKCLGKMQEVTQEEGRTILFVSHNTAAVRKLCGRAILLEHGTVSMDGPTADVLGRYLEVTLNEQATAGISGAELARRARTHLLHPSPLFGATSISLLDESGRARNAFNSDEPVIVSIDYDVYEAVSNLRVVVDLVDDDGTAILRTENLDDPDSHEHYVHSPGTYAARCTLPANLLGERRFHLSVYLICQDVQHISYDQILHFDVAFQGYGDNVSSRSGGGFMRPRLDWEIAVEDRVKR